MLYDSLLFYELFHTLLPKQQGIMNNVDGH